MTDASSFLVEFGNWIKALHSLFTSGLPCRNTVFLSIFRDIKEEFPCISCL